MGVQVPPFALTFFRKTSPHSNCGTIAGTKRPPAAPGRGLEARSHEFAAPPLFWIGLETRVASALADDTDRLAVERDPRDARRAQSWKRIHSLVATPPGVIELDRVP